MWIEGERLQVIDSALERGRRAEVEQLLADVFRTGAGAAAIPSACPTCRRDLVRNPLPGVGLFVSACPDRHGAWMTSDVVETLRRFVDEHATLAAKKRHQLKILNRLLVLLGVVLVAAILYSYPERIVTTLVEAGSRFYDWRVSETYWPERGWVYTHWQIDVKGSSIDVHDELMYFTRLVALLDEGITNRINMDGVLRTRRSPAEYTRLYDVYRGKQLDVLARLRQLAVPDTLASIHAHVLLATEEQIRFYGAFVDAKLIDPSVDLGRMLGDAALQTTNRALHTAWDEIRRRYPRLDVETSGAIEAHLCGFDVI
jgi:hypothetical protein